MRNVIKAQQNTQKPFSQKQLLEYFYQIADCIDYIHQNKILHRDIKPENIFLSKSVIKLGDFGISKELSTTNDFTKTGVGTPYYISPEICRGEKYNYKSDIWSLGCLIYESCSFQRPFHSKSITVLVNNIVNKQPIALDTSLYCPQLISLINSMMHKDPLKRPDIKEVKSKVSALLNNTQKIEKKLTILLEDKQNVSSTTSPGGGLSSSLKFNSKWFNESLIAKQSPDKSCIKPDISINSINELQLTKDTTSASSNLILTTDSFHKSPSTNIKQDNLLPDLSKLENNSKPGFQRVNTMEVKKKNVKYHEMMNKQRFSPKGNTNGNGSSSTVMTSQYNETCRNASCDNNGRNINENNSDKKLRKTLMYNFLLEKYGNDTINQIEEIIKQCDSNEAKDKISLLIGKDEYQKSIKYIQFVAKD